MQQSLQSCQALDQFSLKGLAQVCANNILCIFLSSIIHLCGFPALIYITWDTYSCTECPDPLASPIPAVDNGNCGPSWMLECITYPIVARCYQTRFSNNITWKNPTGSTPPSLMSHLAPRADFLLDGALFRSDSFQFDFCFEFFDDLLIDSLAL